jgi:dTMP kinase
VSGGGRGRLIALEGIDGCGKSTQAVLLADHLGAALSFEPGATTLGASLRRLLLDPELPAVALRAEALLMAADRAQHVADILEPALSAGTWVVTDRFSGSTFAYQGYGRGMDLEELGWLVRWATEGLQPDLVVLIEVPVATAVERRSGERSDRFEGLGEEFQHRVAEGFHQLATDDPATWVVIDGTRSVGEVAADVRSAVRDRLGEAPHG